jgi:GntR family transcriptional regulator
MPAAHDTGAPEIQRTPPYQQIADHFRSQIQAGDLPPGEQLPTIDQIMEQYSVARATAQKAIGQLVVEGVVTTVPGQGTFVSGGGRTARTPTLRLAGPVGRQVGLDEVVLVDEADSRPAPDYVAKVLDLPPAALIVRRQEIISRRSRPVMLTVTWIPAVSKLLAAEALQRQPVPGGVAHLAESVTGRPILFAEEHLEAREADRREADALGIRPGSPVLAVASIWGDADGPMVYVESCLPPDTVVRYPLRVDRAAGVGHAG